MQRPVFPCALLCACLWLAACQPAVPPPGELLIVDDCGAIRYLHLRGQPVAALSGLEVAPMTVAPSAWAHCTSRRPTPPAGA